MFRVLNNPDSIEEKTKFIYAHHLLLGAPTVIYRVTNMADKDSVTLMVAQWNPLPISAEGAEIQLATKYDLEISNVKYAMGDSTINHADPADTGLTITNLSPKEFLLRFSPNNTELIREWELPMSYAGGSTDLSEYATPDICFVQTGTAPYDPTVFSMMTDKLGRSHYYQ